MGEGESQLQVGPCADRLLTSRCCCFTSPSLLFSTPPAPSYSFLLLPHFFLVYLPLILYISLRSLLLLLSPLIRLLLSLSSCSSSMLFPSPPAPSALKSPLLLFLLPLSFSSFLFSLPPTPAPSPLLSHPAPPPDTPSPPPPPPLQQDVDLGAPVVLLLWFAASVFFYGPWRRSSGRRPRARPPCRFIVPVRGR